MKYIDEATARQGNLINGSSSSAARFGVDVTNKTPNGRPSIRLESKKKYDQGLIVLDVEHMPFGCGTWPAFWTLGPNWPKGGEIDILEGVNEYTNNGMTLHTGPGCAIGSDTTQFSGEVTTPNCDVAAEDQSKNVGCSIKHPSTKSYGAGLNKNGGGIYATQWSSDAISIYFFPRGSEPADVLGDAPNPSTWGKPAAKFAGACDIDKMFAEQKIVIDTTFCGDWAGSKDVWNTGSCGKKAATCNDFVRDNPSAFTEAYWTINALKVYQDDGNAAPAPPKPSTPSKSTAVSVPAPIPTKYSSVIPVAPSASSKVASPVIPSPVVPSSRAPGASAKPPVAASPVISAPVVPGISAKPTLPGTPVPDINQPSPGISSVGSQSSAAGASPVTSRAQRPIQSQVAMPTGKFGMPGWAWPVAAGGGSNNQPAAPKPSGPSEGGNTTNAGLAPAPTPAQNTPVQNVLQPSNAPVAEIEPSAGGPAIPVVPAPSQAPAPPAAVAPAQPAAPVTTVYHTIFVTVPAESEATPAPDAKARMARHIREHRRRWTQHNARS